MLSKYERLDLGFWRWHKLVEESGPLIVNTAGIYSARQNKVNRHCTVPGKKTKQLGRARERVRLLRRVIRALAGVGEVGKFLVGSA